MPLGTPTPTVIHQGPGYLYLNVAAPANGKRHLIGSDGTPTQPAWVATTAFAAGQMLVDSNGNVQECTTAGTSGATVPTWATAVGATTTDASVTWTLVALSPSYVFGGAVEGAVSFSVGAKIEEIGADQVSLPIDAVMTDEKDLDKIDVTLKESNAGLLRLLIPHGLYSSGTDTALPSGAQAYEEISFGGLPPTGIPRFGVLVISKRKDQTTKFVWAQLYKAYQADVIKLDIQRGKESVYKVTFKALAALARPAQDQGGKFTRQT